MRKGKFECLLYKFDRISLQYWHQSRMTENQEVGQSFDTHIFTAMCFGPLATFTRCTAHKAVSYQEFYIFYIVELSLFP